jgi:hypothetical protein
MKTQKNKQRGAILLLIMSVVIISSLSALLTNLERQNITWNNNHATKNSQVLAEAKLSLLGWSMRHPEWPGIFPWTDRSADPKLLDGKSDCYGGTLNSAFLLGYLPLLGGYNNCKNFNDISTNIRDSYNNKLWYVVSKNIIRDYDNKKYPKTGLNMLDNNSNWLKIIDKNGNTIDDKVAVIIMSAGKNRTLDSLIINGTTYDNADSNNFDEDFILSPEIKDNNGQVIFDDKLTYITVEELIANLEKKAMSEVAWSLAEYYKNYGNAYPWLSIFEKPDESKFDSQVNKREGYIPYLAVNDKNNQLKFSNELNIIWFENDNDKITFSSDFNIIWNNINNITPTITTTAEPTDTLIWDNNNTWIQLQNSDIASGNKTISLTETDLYGTITTNKKNCIWNNEKETVYCQGKVSEFIGHDNYIKRTYEFDIYKDTYLSNVEVTTNNPTATQVSTRDVFINKGNTTELLRLKRFLIKITDEININSSVGNTLADNLNLPNNILNTATIFSCDIPLSEVLNSSVIRQVNTGMTGEIHVKDIRMNPEFPTWYIANKWHHVMYAGFASGYVAGGSNTCIAGSSCLTLNFEKKDGTSTILRNDIVAILINAGRKIHTQIRPSADIDNYFAAENANNINNDTFSKGEEASNFNDIIRILK